MLRPATTPAEKSTRTSACEINCAIVADFGRKIEACESIHESKIDSNIAFAITSGPDHAANAADNN
jgi:hypothetical protein